MYFLICIKNVFCMKSEIYVINRSIKKVSYEIFLNLDFKLLLGEFCLDYIVKYLLNYALCMNSKSSVINRPIK